MQTQGMLTVEELAELAHTGQIDTVLCQFTDLQGRFMGKRVLPDFFLEDVLGAEGLHACLYLLAIDMEMEPLPGYAYASWDTGYGDFRMIPDLATLRLCPWLEKTAMVICDIADEETSEPTAVAPRRSCAHRSQPPPRWAIWSRPARSSSSTCSKIRSRRWPTTGTATLGRARATSWTTTCCRPPRTNGSSGRSATACAAPASRSSSARASSARASTRSTSRYSDALSNADHHTLYKHGAKEIAALNDVAVTFMAKWTMAEAGSSCHLHSSVWRRRRRERLMWADDGEHHMSDTYRWYLGGLMATAREMSWMYAPFVNSYKRYQLGSWAPTAIVWSHDNRTCGYRTVGEHTGLRVECRIPGADANPYLAFAATIASRAVGHPQQIEPPEMFVGNAYEAKDVPRVPTIAARGDRGVPSSDGAREALRRLRVRAPAEHRRAGADHLRQPVVTDWELARYFERG